MTRTQYARYMHTDEYGRRRPTTWAMTAEQAAAKLVDPQIIESSIEWRDLPEPGERLYGPSHYPDCRNGGKD